MNFMTQSNKKGWDGLAEAHYKNYHTEKLIAGEPLLNELIKKEVGDVKDKSLVHLLCHIGTDTLSWALLGARVPGCQGARVPGCQGDWYRYFIRINKMCTEVSRTNGN